jgi:hypothetical protein
MEPLDKEVKRKSKEYAVGIDITDSFAQISVGAVDTDGVETMSVNMGKTDFLVPTALFKRSEVNQWFAGFDALKYKETEGYFIDKLVSKARANEIVTVGTEEFKPSALMALFLKRLLTLAGRVTPLSGIVSIMITVDILDGTLINVLNEAVSSLSVKSAQVHFQNHMESFYNYMLYQPRDLWNRDVVLIDSTGEYIKSLRMECNKNTTPIVAFIDSHEDLELKSEDYDEPGYPGKFTAFTESIVEGHMISSIYLIGDSFKYEWCKEGISFLCKKGRVFQGNNLFSKGAAYAARNRMNPTAISTGHAFLGNDKLKANVGINALERGEKSYLPLLDGGINWFDGEKECDIILNQGNKLTFLITPLTGKNPQMVDITLGDLPKRPPRTTRLHIKVKMVSESKLKVTIKDMGFGELFPAANIEWNEVISV